MTDLAADAFLHFTMFETLSSEPTNHFSKTRHCEEPTGPARSGRPDDRLRDEAIKLGGSSLIAPTRILAMTDLPYMTFVIAPPPWNADCP
jgi:hypothetical protein